MEVIKLTKNELSIIFELRSLPPYGKIEVSADQNGKFDTYLVHKSQKIVLKPDNI
jgi:hypothetical protein